jgi:DNA-directed RNA polymerase specialized sigma24 family protein
LVRKASSIRQKELLGNWLFGVAYRVALRARSAGVRRKQRAGQVGELADLAADGRSDHQESVREALRQAEETLLIHEEVYRLPVKYRSPVVLCYFEGFSHEEAASQLGWPIGTVKGRLSRARDLLGSRLSRRGLTLASSALAATLAVGELQAAVPPPLARSTLLAAKAIVPGNLLVSTSCAAVSNSVASLTEGVIRAMLMSKIKSILVSVLITVGLLTTCASVIAFQGYGGRSMRAAAQPTRPSRTHTADTAKAQAPQPGSQQGGQKPEAPASGVPGQGGGFGGQIGGFGGDGGGEAPDESQTRITIAGLSAAISVTDKNPKNLELNKRLERPVTLSFPTETPLEHVLKQIKDASKGQDGKRIPIYVDPLGLSEADKTMQSTVVIDLEDVPLRISLRLVLKQLGLAYCIRDGVLIISSVPGIQQELREAEAEQIGTNPEKAPAMMRFGGVGGMSGGMGMMSEGLR